MKVYSRRSSLAFDCFIVLWYSVGISGQVRACPPDVLIHQRATGVAHSIVVFAQIFPHRFLSQRLLRKGLGGSRSGCSSHAASEERPSVGASIQSWG